MGGEGEEAAEDAAGLSAEAHSTVQDWGSGVVDIVNVCREIRPPMPGRSPPASKRFTGMVKSVLAFLPTVSEMPASAV